MSSFRRITSSQINGSLSKGPVTEEGKRRAALNAMRHGLLAKTVVLDNECEENFRELLQQHIDDFSAEGPLSGPEMGAIENMVAAYWRMRRLWAIENRLLNDQMSHLEADDELGRLTQAWSQLAETNKFNLLSRYEGRFQRAYQRSFRHLQQSQTRAPRTIEIVASEKKEPNEPTL